MNQSWIRSSEAAKPAAVQGRGRLHAALASAVRRWRPSIRLLVRDEPPGYSIGAGMVVIFPIAGHLAALGHAGCAGCLALRLLGKRGVPGEAQTLPGSARPLGTKVIRRAVPLLLSELEARTPTGDEVILIASEAHRSTVLRHGDCPVCGSSSRHPPTDITAALKAKPRSARATARSALVDPLLGPLEINEQRGPKGKYPLGLPFLWGSVYLSRKVGTSVRCASTHGGIYASDPNPILARQIALSEGVERLAARGARPDYWGPIRRYRNAVPLQSLYSYSRPKDERRSRGFCQAYDLIERRSRLVPWESVVVGLPKDLYPQSLRREVFYTGTASHLTFAQAVVHATLELVKRDALMIAWYRRCRLKRLTWPRKAPPLVERRAQYLRKAGLEVELFHLRIDFPLPMLLMRITATRRRGNWPRGGVLFVASIGFTPLEALADGLRLACSQFVSYGVHPHPMKNPLDRRSINRMAKIAEFWPLIASYLDPTHSRSAHSFLGEGGAKSFEDLRSVPVHTTAEKVRSLRGYFSERKLPWLAVRLTDECARSAGFESTKIVVPGMIVPTATRDTVDFGLPRFQRSWPLASAGGLNPFPHPAY